ncbi:MAG: hypothetical protein WCF84_05600 [Anaerolineae bacterium]
MPTALIVIGRFKPAWNELSEEEQGAFVARVGRTARTVGVTAVVGYKLSTPGSFLEVWEADDKTTLEAFIGELDALGYKKYYDEVLMLGEREGNWISTAATAAPVRDPDSPPKPGRSRSTPTAKRSGPARPKR